MTPRLALLPIASLLVGTFAVAQEPVLPVPGQGLTVGEAGLLELIQSYGELLELEPVIDAGTEHFLRGAPVTLLGETEVPAEAVHEYVQGILLLAGFVLVPGPDGLHVRAAAAPGEPLRVTPDQLPALRGHNALFVRLPVELHSADARQISVSMRALGRPGTAAPNLRALDETTLVLEGAAEDVCLMAEQLALFGSSSEAAQPAPVDWKALFPATEEPFPIERGESLLSVLRRYHAVTGRNFWLPPTVRGFLEAQSAGLTADLNVAPERVHAVVEALLASRGVTLGALRTAAPSLYSVQRGSATWVPRYLRVDLAAERPVDLREHPALLIGGTLDLDKLEIRQLTTSLRMLLTDTSSMSILALTDHDLALHAPGARAALLAETLQRLNGDTPAGPTGLASFPQPEGPGPTAVHPAREGDPVTLGDLVRAWGQATGYGLVVAPLVESRLKARTLEEGTFAEVGPADNAAVQGALAEEQASLMPMLMDPPLLAVGGPSRTSADYLLVGVDELDALAAFPALMVSLLWRPESLEPRRAATHVRAWMDNPRLQHVVCPDGKHLMIGGTAGTVRDWLARLREYDAAGKLPERR